MGSRLCGKGLRRRNIGRIHYENPLALLLDKFRSVPLMFRSVRLRWKNILQQICHNEHAPGLHLFGESDILQGPVWVSLCPVKINSLEVKRVLCSSSHTCVKLRSATGFKGDNRWIIRSSPWVVWIKLMCLFKRKLDSGEDIFIELKCKRWRFILVLWTENKLSLVMIWERNECWPTVWIYYHVDWGIDIQGDH
jgi:hypothetical protein